MTVARRFTQQLMASKTRNR